jgi:hypothetical protein
MVTISTYINTLTEVGLTVEQASEPPTPRKLADSPSLAGLSRPVWEEVPAVLVVKCGKHTPDRHR